MVDPEEIPALEQRVSDIGRSLASSIERVVAALPGPPRGPVELARALGVDKGVSSRLLKAARMPDPLAVAQHIPGPEVLRRLLNASRRKGVNAELLREAMAAVDAFDALIRDQAGDRATFDGILAAWLPDSRRQFELQRKQWICRGMSQLLGIMVETHFATALIHPSEAPARLDVVWIIGLLGIRRLRPDVSVQFSSWVQPQQRPEREPATLSGDDLLAGSVRLDQFCTLPAAQIEIERKGELTHYQLGDHGFGPSSSVDLVIGECNRGAIARYSPPDEPRRTGVGTEIEKPTRRLHLDVLLHEAVYPGQEPELFMFDTSFRGMANVNDGTREADRYDLLEEVVSLGRGLRRFRSPHVPRYVEMLEFVAAKTGWDLERFRGSRCEIDYPLVGTQVTMAIWRPPAPTAE